MKVRVSELMENYADSAYDLTDRGNVPAERVRELTMEKVNALREKKLPPVRRRRGRRLRAVFMAAALIMLLSVTAYAAYQLRMEDYIKLTDPSTGITLLYASGTTGSPESLARDEWHSYLLDTEEEQLAAWSDNGGYYGQDDYHTLYLACTRQAGEELDRILEKYGLSHYNSCTTFTDLRKLYQLLGTEPFLSDPLDVDAHPGSEMFGSCVYDNGAARVQMYITGRGFHWNVSLLMVPKGTLSYIGEAAIALGEDYEEWSYETAGGITADLVLSKRGALVIAELDGAFVWVCLDETSPMTRETLEQIADSVDFSILADRYPAAP